MQSAETMTQAEPMLPEELYEWELAFQETRDVLGDEEEQRASEYSSLHQKTADGGAGC